MVPYLLVDLFIYCSVNNLTRGLDPDFPYSINDERNYEQLQLKLISAVEQFINGPESSSYRLSEQGAISGSVLLSDTNRATLCDRLQYCSFFRFIF